MVVRVCTRMTYQIALRLPKGHTSYATADTLALALAYIQDALQMTKDMPGTLVTIEQRKEEASDTKDVHDLQGRN